MRATLEGTTYNKVIIDLDNGEYENLTKACASKGKAPLDAIAEAIRGLMATSAPGRDEVVATVWPLTVYWEDGSLPRDDLACLTEDEAEAAAWEIEHTWPGVLAVHVEAPAEDADAFEIVDREKVEAMA